MRLGQVIDTRHDDVESRPEHSQLANTALSAIAPAVPVAHRLAEPFDQRTVTFTDPALAGRSATADTKRPENGGENGGEPEICITSPNFLLMDCPA
ncbi:MAG TPA: hypothetical protein VLA88_00775 [Candidatus Saccharimonadales bacterium]|nr:hypothetical protein [Candidatus Saccharimonadales bacterium]